MVHESIKERVVQYVRDKIVSGEYPRGSRLTHTAIADEMQIGLTPVRGALRVLQEQGYASGAQHRSSRVAPHNSSSVSEVLSLRLALETRLVDAAAQRITADGVYEARTLAEGYALALKQGKLQLARGLNYRLHHRIYEIARLPQTLHLVQLLWDRYPFESMNSVPGRGDDAISEHEELIDSIGSADRERAVISIQKHIEAGWDAIKMRKS